MMYLNHLTPSNESTNVDTIYTQQQQPTQQQQQQNFYLLQQHFALQQQQQEQQRQQEQQHQQPPQQQHQSPSPQQFQEPVFELKLEPDQYFDPSQSFILTQPLLPVSPIESPIREPSYYSPPQKVQKSFSGSFVPSPPASPMASPLGSPNRSCASCKKRKVKCDRKTPSCSACSKSKLQCFYTSYSPPAFVERQTVSTTTDQPQSRPSEQTYEQEEEESEVIKSLRKQLERVEKEGRDRWERMQKIVSELKASQQQFARITSQYIPLQSQDSTFPFLLPDEDAAIFKLNLSNPKPASPPPVTIKTSPSLVMRNKTNAGTSSYGHANNFNPYPTHNLRQQQQQTSSVFFPSQQPELASTNFTYSTNTSTHIFHPYKKARITFNYNLAGFRPLLVRAIFPILRSMTSGAAARLFPSAGFTDAAHIQSWLRSTFLALVYEDFNGIFDPKVEKLQLSSFDDTSATGILSYQKFDLILSRVFREQQQSSSSSGQINNGYGETDQTEMGKHGSDDTRSSDPSDDLDQLFLERVYAIIQLFVKQVPWIRENYLVGILNDGIFSDVIIEVFGNSASSSSEKKSATTESFAADSDDTFGINDDIVVKRGRFFL